MKGFVDYICEESRRVEQAIERDNRRKERRELDAFIARTRREIAETEEWIRREEEAERTRQIEPSAMFHLLKNCGAPTALGSFDFRDELAQIASAMQLTAEQAALYILIAGLQSRCPIGVGAIHLATYTGSAAWTLHLRALLRCGLVVPIRSSRTNKVYYQIRYQ